MNKAELIKHYAKNLEKVKKVYGGDCLGKSYIDFAQGQLDAVVTGGMDSLLEYWKKHNEETESVAK
jgi:hypothetical protein